MTVKELYCDDRFSSILYYLSENGYVSVPDLESFDFDELYFVPGVDSALVEEAKDIYLNKDDIVSVIVDTPCEHIEKSDEELQEQPVDDNGLVAVDEDNELNELFEECGNVLDIALRSVTNNERIIALVRLSALKKDDAVEKQIILDLCNDLKHYVDCVNYSPELIQKMKKIKIDYVFCNTCLDTGRKCGALLINYCHINGMDTLWDMRDFDFDTTNIKGMSFNAMQACYQSFKSAIDSMKNGESDFGGELVNQKSSKEKFVASYNSLTDNERFCLDLVAMGATLQVVADELGVTRSRSQQYCAKCIKKMCVVTRVVADELFSKHNNSFTMEHLSELLGTDVLARACAYILSEDNNGIVHWRFANKFFNSLPTNWKQCLDSIITDVVGDGINYYENMERIEELLIEAELPMIDFYDFLSYLLANGYKLYGDYVASGRHAYTLICLDVIKRYFPESIKLDSDDDNSDMLRLRAIVREKYGDYQLPDKNRAITARISDKLILCGRGRYCLPEKAIYNASLIDDIIDYINNSSENSLFYSEIFAAFQGRLMMETNIENYHFLHGVLKYCYPDDFDYNRDTVTKHGGQRADYCERLTQVICSMGRSVSKAELQQAIPGITDARISNSLIRSKELIQWDYNLYNHINNICFKNNEKDILRDILSDICEENCGYCSERKIFSMVRHQIPEFLNRNGMEHSLNLFYVLGALFDDQYRFSRPHIVSSQFENTELSSINIAVHLMGGSDKVNYQKLVEIANEHMWSTSAIGMVSKAFDDDYVRINEDDYKLKSEFVVAQPSLERVKDILCGLIGSMGHTAFFAINDYRNFPDIGYEWNEYILQTILRKYDLGFKILEPMMTDRRYLRGIIVPTSISQNDYASYVASVMEGKGVSSISQDRFVTFLRNNNLLLTENIPQDFYMDGVVKYVNGNFVCTL